MIPGVKNPEQIEENAKTMEFGSMSTDTIQQITDLFADIRVEVQRSNLENFQYSIKQLLHLWLGF